jgi:hypothetical protein
MDLIQQTDPRSYGPRRHVASLFGIRLISDLGEKLCELGLPAPLGRKRRARLTAIRRAGVLFVHVPKNGGMSISSALYGQQVKHASISYYHRVAPDLVDLPSAAILRDPIDRFLSAYAYARAGGSHDNRVSIPFRERYRALAGVDDALDHIEQAQDLYQIDHIFPPQSRYVTDHQGAVAVDRLVMLEALTRLSDLAPHLPDSPLPHLNRTDLYKPALTGRQIVRILAFYAEHVALVEAVRRRSRNRAHPMRAGIAPGSYYNVVPIDR